MSCETVAWGKCLNCAQPVAVKKNRSGLAYYRCDHCGIQMQHHWHRSSDKMLQGLGVAAPEKRVEPVKEVAEAVGAQVPAGGWLEQFGIKG